MSKPLSLAEVVSQLDIAESLIREVLASGALDMEELHCQVCKHSRKSNFPQYKAGSELGGVVTKLQKLSAILRKELEEGTNGHQRSSAENG